MQEVYWLSLLKDTGYIDLKYFESIYEDENKIEKILFSILKTTRINMNE